jgi:hypothetical protein
MKMKAVLPVVLLLAACGGPESESEEETPKGGVIGETYVESLGKAEAVEDLVEDRKKELDDALDGAE